MKCVLVPVFVFAVLLLSAPKVKADCCPFAGGAGWITCDDGTSSGGGCCGVGPCNIFCCNCDGGCRKSNNRDQCYASCKGQRGVCWSGCDLSCSIAHDCGVCYDACNIAMDQCDAGCDRQFPGLAAAAPSPYRAVQPPSKERISLGGLVRFSEVDTNRDGYITKDEVRNWLKANPYMAKCATDQAFADADKNRDGRLTLDEVDMPAAEWLKKNVGPQTKTPQAAQGLNLYLLTILKTLK